MDLTPGAPPVIPPPHLREEPQRPERTPRALAALWLGMFLAPAAFFIHLQVAYVLVPWACATGSHFSLHLVALLAVITSLVGVLLARSQREQFLGLVGSVTSAMFALILIAQWVAGLFITPCQ